MCLFVKIWMWYGAQPQQQNESRDIGHNFVIIQNNDICRGWGKKEECGASRLDKWRLSFQKENRESRKRPQMTPQGSRSRMEVHG